MQDTTISLSVGHASHQGLVRELNEDSYLVLTSPVLPPEVDALLLVGDGVGGENAGEIASGILVESFWNWFANRSYIELVHYNPAHADYFIAVVKELLELVNEHLHRLANSHRQLTRMGTTATLGIISGQRLFLGHVGDSRAYMLRQGTLHQLTNDHTWVATEVAAGRLSMAEATNHPRRHQVHSVLGVSAIVRIERNAFQLMADDLLLFASDGLTGAVPNAEIGAMLLQHGDPQQAAGALIQRANQYGGADNITVVVCQILNGQLGSNLPNGVAFSSHYLSHLADSRGEQTGDPSTAAATSYATTAIDPGAARTGRRRSSRPSRAKTHTSRAAYSRRVRYVEIALLLLASALIGAAGTTTAWLAANANLERWLPFAGAEVSGLLAIFALWFGYGLCQYYRDNSTKAGDRG